MTLDKFLDEFLGCLTNQRGIDSIKKGFRENLHGIVDYDTTKVEFQVFKDDDNFDCDVCIDAEGYDDGEIVFIDCYI